MENPFTHAQRCNVIKKINTMCAIRSIFVWEIAKQANRRSIYNRLNCLPSKPTKSKDMYIYIYCVLFRLIRKPNTDGFHV